MPRIFLFKAWCCACRQKSIYSPKITRSSVIIDIFHCAELCQSRGVFVHQDVVSHVNTSVQPERNSALKANALQVLLVFAVAAIFYLVSGKTAFFALLFGGLASVLPSALFATLVFTFFNPQALKRLAIVFFLGEFVKLLISSVLLAAIIVHMPGYFLPIVVGFFTAWAGNWLAPLFFNRGTTR